MTTIIDLGLLDAVWFIFPMLLIYAVMLGVLTYKETFSPVISNIIAIISALITLFVPKVLEVIQLALPWMVLVIMFGLIMIVMAKFFGVDDDAIKAAWGQEGLVMWVLAIFIVIILASVTTVFFADGNFLDGNGDALNSISDGKGEGELRFWNTIFHPNVLGFILIMLIAVFSVALVSGRSVK